MAKTVRKHGLRSLALDKSKVGECGQQFEHDLQPLLQIVSTTSTRFALVLFRLQADKTTMKPITASLLARRGQPVPVRSKD